MGTEKGGLDHHLLPLWYAPPPNVVTGGAGELPIHGGNEVFLGSLEHAEVGFRQGQEGGRHSLQDGDKREVTPHCEPKHTSALFPLYTCLPLLRHGCPPLSPPVDVLLHSTYCCPIPWTHLDVLVLLHVLRWVLGGDIRGSKWGRSLDLFLPLFVGAEWPGAGPI